MNTNNGDTLSVPLEILSDEVVEGMHDFITEVQQSSPVIPWSPANIYIVDNDSECSYRYQNIFHVVHMLYL